MREILTSGVLGLLILSTLGGCGGSAEGPTAGPSLDAKSVAPMSEAALEAKGRLVGTWNGKVDILTAGVERKRQSLTGEKLRQFESQLDRFAAAEMTLDLRKDDTMEMKVAMANQGRRVTQPSGGRWEILEADADGVVVDFVRSEDSYRQTQRFRFDSPDTLIAAPPGGGEFAEVAQIRFERLR